MNIYLQEKQGDFLKAIEFFKSEILNIRTGRANPSMLEGVQVEAYGTRTPITGLASTSVQDGQSILVTPWDKSVLKDLEKAIVAAGLGVGVVNDGEKLRLSIPKMTEENRKDLVKKLNEKYEQARISFRKVRDDVKQDIERAEKNSDLTEDDKYDFIRELDEEVRGKNDELKKIRDKKEEDIMTI